MNGGPYAQQEADAQAAAAQEQMQRDQEAQEQVQQEQVQDQAQQVQQVQAAEPSGASEKTQSPQANSQVQQPAVAPAANTWSAKLTAKSSWGAKSASPNRTTRMHVRDHLTTNILRNSGGSKDNTMRIARSAHSIRTTLDAAIRDKNPNTLIWVSYNGHQKPFIPRAIHPTKWAREKDSFLAIQHKSRSNTEQRFFLQHVIEVRNKQWRIPGSQLSQLKQKYGANQDGGTWQSGYNGPAGGGGGRDRARLSGGGGQRRGGRGGGGQQGGGGGGGRRGGKGKQSAGTG